MEWLLKEKSFETEEHKIYVEKKSLELGPEVSEKD